MNIESFIFIALFLGANAFFAVKAMKLVRFAQAARGVAWSSPRLDRIPERISTTLANVFGQKAVLKNPIPGIMHFLIFWGFLVITVGTLELFVKEVVPTASFEFIGETAYGALMVLEDTFSVLVFAALLFALFRRHVVKPPGLGKSTDADIILFTISMLMVSLWGMNAFRMVAAPQWYDSSLWFSKIIAGPVQGLNLEPSTAILISNIFKWVHLALVLGFLMYIPSSKHLHVLAAGPNTFLRKLDRPKGMKTLNLEDETATTFGAQKVSDLSWKDVLDGYACTECGRCQDACPAWNTGKPLSPKKLILFLKDDIYQNETALLTKNYEAVAPILDENITDEFIWACTSCRACEIACPVFIEQTDKIYDIRRSMVLMESRFPTELNAVFKNMETNFSPWAMSPEDRAKWTDDLTDEFKVKTMSEVAASGEKVEYLFWVGCAGSFDDRNKKVSRSLAKLMKKAGVSFAILGTEEKCTGDPVRRMGNEYLAQTLIKENVETLNRYAVTKVVTACPHCFNAIQNEWKDFGGNFEVIHHSQLLADLVKRGALTPKDKTEGASQKITYHDSCYMGRWNGEYSAARNILNTLPQTDIIEMPRNKEKGMCCGAGGGRMWMEETIGKRVNIARTEEAVATTATTIAANCPFCMTMLSDGVKATEAPQGEVVVKDIAELLDERIG